MNFRFAFPRSFLSLRRRYRRFARKSRLHRRSLSSFMSLLFLVQFVLAPTGVFAQTFDRLDEDVNKNRIGDYANAVEGADDEDDWNEFVGSGADLLRAEWEYRADLLLEQEVTAGAAREDLEAEKALAREAWEAELDDEIDQRRGRWRARTAAQSLDSLLDDIDYDELVAAVNDANALMFTDADDAATRVAAWDAIAGNRAALAKAAWESQLDAEMAALQSQGVALGAEEQAAFLSELERQRSLAESVYKSEESVFVTSARRKFVTEANAGDDLARALAQSTDPAEIARLLVQQTELEMERLGVLPGDVRFDGVDAQLILTGAGDYQDQVSQALEAGQSAWKSAIDELIARKIGFDEQVAASRQAGENQWATAYTTILDARETWLADVEAQIQRGLEAWDAAESGLAENRQLAEEELARLIESDRREFQEHNRGIGQLVSGASQTLETIVENQRWFQHKIADLQADIVRLNGESESFADGLAIGGTPEWTAWYNAHRTDHTNAEMQERQNRINVYTGELNYWNSLEAEYRQIITDAESVVHDQDMRDGGSGPGYFHDDGTEGDVLLLTATEFELKLARARLAVLEEERSRAKEVYDYALAATKLSAAEIETQLATAKDAYDLAETEYLTELSALNGGGSQSLTRVGLSDESSRAAGETTDLGPTLLDDVNTRAAELETEALELERARTALDNARQAYEQTVKLQVLIQNPQMLSDIGLLSTDPYEVNEDGENEGLRYEIFKAEKDLAEAREKMRQQEKAYVRLLYERETALRSTGFFNQTNERIILHEETKDRLAELSAIIGGGDALEDKLTALAAGTTLTDLYGNQAADALRDRITELADALANAAGPVTSETQNLNTGLGDFGPAHAVLDANFTGAERARLTQYADRVDGVLDALADISGLDWTGLGLPDMRALATSLRDHSTEPGTLAADYSTAFNDLQTELTAYQAYAAANAGAEASADYQARTAAVLIATDEYRLAAARYEQRYQLARSAQAQLETLLDRALTSGPILTDATLTGDARSAALATITAQKDEHTAVKAEALAAIESVDAGFEALVEAFTNHGERLGEYRTALGERNLAYREAGDFLTELHENLRGSLASQRSQLGFLLDENADEALLESMDAEHRRGLATAAAETNLRAIELLEGYLGVDRDVNVLLIEVTEDINHRLANYDATDAGQRRELTALRAVEQYVGRSANLLANLSEDERAELLAGLADERDFAIALRDFYVSDGVMDDAEQLAIRSGGNPEERRLLSAYFNPPAQMMFGEAAFGATAAESYLTSQHRRFAEQVRAGLIQSAITDRYHEEQENKITGLIQEMKTAVPALASLSASQLYNDSEPVDPSGLAHDTDAEDARRAILASLLSAAGSETGDRLTALYDIAQLETIYGPAIAVEVYTDLARVVDGYGSAGQELVRASQAIVDQAAEFDAEVDALLDAYDAKLSYEGQRDRVAAALALLEYEDPASGSTAAVGQADVDAHVANLDIPGGDDPAVDHPADWTPVDDTDGDSPGDAGWDPSYETEVFVQPYAGLDASELEQDRDDLNTALADWDNKRTELDTAIATYRAAKATFDAFVAANPGSEGTPAYEAEITTYAAAVNDMYFAYREHNNFFTALEFVAERSAASGATFFAAAQAIDASAVVTTEESAFLSAADVLLTERDDRAQTEFDFTQAAVDVGTARNRYTEAESALATETTEADDFIADLGDRVDVRISAVSTDAVSANELIDVLAELRRFFTEKQARGEEINPTIVNSLEAAGQVLDELAALKDYQARGASVSVEDARQERTDAQEESEQMQKFGEVLLELQQFIANTEAAGAGLHEQGAKIKELLAKYEKAKDDYGSVYTFSAEVEDAMTLLRDHAWAQHKRQLVDAYLAKRGQLSVDEFMEDVVEGRFFSQPVNPNQTEAPTVTFGGGVAPEAEEISGDFLGQTLDAAQLSEVRALLSEYAARARIDDAGIVADIDALLATEDAAVRAAIEDEALVTVFNNFNSANAVGVGNHAQLPDVLKNYGLVSAYESYAVLLQLDLDDADDRTLAMQRFLDTMTTENRAAAEPVLSEYLTNFDARNPSFYLPAELKARHAKERYFAMRYTDELSPGDVTALNDWLAAEKYDAGVSGAVGEAVRTAYILDNYYGESADDYLDSIDADLTALTGTGVNATERQAFVLGLTGLLSAAGDAYVEPEAMIAGEVVYDNFTFADNTQALKEALRNEQIAHTVELAAAERAAVRAGYFYDYKSGARTIRSFKSYVNIGLGGLAEPDEATQIAGQLAELEHQAEHRLGAFVGLVEQYSSFAYNPDPAYDNNLNIRDTIAEINTDFVLQDGQYAKNPDGSYVFEGGLNNTQVRLDEYVNANTAAFTAADRDAYAQVQKWEGQVDQLQETIVTAGQEAVIVSNALGTYGSDVGAITNALQGAREEFEQRERDFGEAEEEYENAEDNLRDARNAYRAQQELVLTNYNALKSAEEELDRLSGLHDQAVLEEYSQQTNEQGEVETIGDTLETVQARYEAADEAYQTQLEKIQALEEKLDRQVTKAELAAAAEVQTNRQETEDWAMHAMRFSRAESILEDKINDLHVQIDNLKGQMEYAGLGQHFDISRSRFVGKRQDLDGYLDYGSAAYIDSERMHRARYRHLEGFLRGEIGPWDLIYSSLGGIYAKPYLGVTINFTEASGGIYYTDVPGWSEGLRVNSGGRYDLYGFAQEYNQGKTGTNDILLNLVKDQFPTAWDGEAWAYARATTDAASFNNGMTALYNSDVAGQAVIYAAMGAAGLGFLFQLYAKDTAFKDQLDRAMDRLYGLPTTNLVQQGNELKNLYAELHRLTDIDSVEKLRDVLDDPEYGLTADDVALIQGSGTLDQLIWKGGKEDLSLDDVVGANGLPIAQDKAIHDEFGFYVRDGEFSAGNITANPTGTDKYGRRTALMVSADEFTDALAAMSQTQYEIEREEYFRAAETMTEDRVQADTVTILDEREEFYGTLMQQAASVGVQFEMYRALAEDYHGEGGVVDQVAELEIQQRVASQRHEWDLRMEQFRKKRQEWGENIAQLTNVGEQKWSDMTTEMATAWNEWRKDFDAEAKAAEDLYLERISEAIVDEQEWTQEFTTLAAQGTDEQTLRELYEEINAMVTNLRSGLPADMQVDINANEILNRVLANKPDTLNESVVMAGEYANTQIFLNELKDQNFDNSIQDRYDDLNERYGEMAQRLVRLQSLDSLYGLIDLFDETIAEANARLQLQMDQKMGQTNWVKMGDLYTKQIKTAQAVLTGQPSIPVFAPSFHDYFYLKPDLRSEAVVKDSEGKEWNLTDTESILADGGPNSAELESMVRLVRNKLEKEFEQTYDPDEEVDYEGTSGLVFINWQQALADASAAAINPSTCNLAESMDECARNIMQSGYTVGLVEGGTFGRHHFEEYYRALTIRNFFDQMEADGRAMRESTGGRMGRDFGTNLTALHRGAVRNMSSALDVLERNSKYVQMLQVANRQLPIAQAQIGAARRGLDQYEDMNQRVRVGLSKGWQRNDDEIDAVIKVGGTIVAGVLYAVSFVFPPAAAIASGVLAAVGSYSGVRGSYEGGTKGALAGAASVVPAIVSKGAVNTNLSYTFQEGWSVGVGAEVSKGVGLGVSYSEQAGWGGSISLSGSQGVGLDFSIGEQGRYGVGLSVGGLWQTGDASGGADLGWRVGYNTGPEGETYSVGLTGYGGEKYGPNGNVGIGVTYNQNLGNGYYISGGANGGAGSGYFGGTASWNWTRFGGSSATFGLTYKPPRPDDDGSPIDTPEEKTALDMFLAAARREAGEVWDDVGGGLGWLGEQVAGGFGWLGGAVTGGLASVAGALGWESGANWIRGKGYYENALVGNLDYFMDTSDGRRVYWDPEKGAFFTENPNGNGLILSNALGEPEYLAGPGSEVMFQQIQKDPELGPYVHYLRDLSHEIAVQLGIEPPEMPDPRDPNFAQKFEEWKDIFRAWKHATGTSDLVGMTGGPIRQPPKLLDVLRKLHTAEGWRDLKTYLKIASGFDDTNGMRALFVGSKAPSLQDLAMFAAMKDWNVIHSGGTRVTFVDRAGKTQLNVHTLAFEGKERAFHHVYNRDGIRVDPVTGDAIPVGDFTGLKGASLDKLMQRIPSPHEVQDWRIRKLTPDTHGALEGWEFVWRENGTTKRLRIHSPDVKRSEHTHAGSGWTFRLQVGRRYVDSDGHIHAAGIGNVDSPNYNPDAINETHIPIYLD